MKRSPNLSLIAVAFATVTLSACGMIGSRSDYKEAVETRPLEVPPDLDTPPGANELVVPDVGSGAAAQAAAAAPVYKGPAEVHIDGSDAGQAWKRIGSVLEHADIGSISARDEAAHTYAFDFDAEYQSKNESRGMLGAVFHHLGFGEGKHIKQAITLSISDETGGARVTIDGNGTDRAAAFASQRTARELVHRIPGATMIGKAEAAPAPASAAAPASAPEASAISSTPPAISGVGVAGADLHVADTVDHTWTRVGLALDHADVGTVAARDPSAHTYTLNFAGTVEVKPAAKHHWYSRILHPFGGGGAKTEQVTRTLTVRVAEDTGGARVSVEGDTADKATGEAARRVTDALRGELSRAMPAAPMAANTAPQPASATSAPSAPSAPPAVSGVSIAGAGLHVADTVGHTWMRVGLALERGDVGTVAGRDENAHTYTVNFSGTVEVKPAAEHHWYSRILHPFGGGGAKTEQVTRTLTVRVREDAGGARVSVEGDTADKETGDAARRVIEVLRDRLS